VSQTIDILNPQKPKQIAIIASNPSVSKQTGWPIGFWWSELTHPYWEFSEHGYRVDIYSPDGGKLEADAWSDPRDQSKYSAHDLISLGFICSREHANLVEDSRPIKDLKIADYDAVLLVGGQAPMFTYYNDQRVHNLATQSYKAGKITAILCHATCILLKLKIDGNLLVSGKTWTGFANSEERYADEFVGKRIQPFWIEEEAKKLPGTNFIVDARFKPHAVRDGNLITGQEQSSGGVVARLVVVALGV